MKKLIWNMTAILVLITCISCNKNELLLELDNDLIGSWETHYSRRDMNNGITSITEDLIFYKDNTGRKEIFKFKNLDISSPFKWSGYGGTLSFYYNDKTDEVIKRNYLIRNDSLIFENRFFYKKSIVNRKKDAISLF